MPGESKTIQGPCAYYIDEKKHCEAADDEVLVAEECSAPGCGNYVHHFCSNSVLDGDLGSRACSPACTSIVSGAIAPDGNSAPSETSVVATKGRVKEEEASRPRSAGQGGIKAKLTCHDFAGVDVKSLSSWDESPDEGSKKSDDDDENEDKENEIASKADKKRRRKFFFDQKADLALLKEMLANEPFAGGHGKIGARYQLVADNLSAHLKLDQKLSKRTVQERFALLLDEFKQNDQAYRKKT
ncbi:hypothetical protein PPTG_16083 [Phytophthora nicotianae INRA-310]|uniref:Uncharacterized protein n=1 Tax=Phytophthora nicotianae (strain INRA-310) TaxID=761204 RepID=W2PSV0_PHYN3|nr:hypothetical protein PPTG_16083 [Phytophthora nicotianae INRA-310]ETN03095.1 hypothetical protein PPTG_16083 [Phytophthora nicotianae INRA-310]